MHHTRRKSGHGSMTDVRKAASASDSKHRTSSSKQTTSSGTHSSGRRPGTAQSSSKNSSKHDSSRDQDEDYWYDDERESFPQFCMTCEKQFVAKDDLFLYCSQACRDYDQKHGTRTIKNYSENSYMSSRIYYPEREPYEPRDIIPRASPSRPSSTYYSHTQQGMPSAMSSMPTTSTSSAIAALRSLSLRDTNPSSPTTAPTSTGIWPFSSARSAAISPNNSYEPSYATTYNDSYYRTGAPNYYSYGSESAGYAEAGAERPLPPRRPGSYSRPKSIDLVTPLLGQ